MLQWIAGLWVGPGLPMEATRSMTRASFGWFLDAVARYRAFRDVLEIGIVALSFLLYFLVRGGVVGEPDVAIRHARDIISLEQRLGVYWEPDLQEAVLGKRALIQLFNGIYFWLDFPVIAAVGLWLYFFRRHNYTVARDAVLASGAIALIIYYLYPVAPPRLVPDTAFVDSVNKFTHFSYQAQSMQAFVNPYAAVPSLHFGWSVLIAAAMYWTIRNVAVRLFAVVLPFGQLASIVFTANHFIFDAFIGIVVCLGGVGIAIALQRWGYPAMRVAYERLRQSLFAGS